MNTEDEHYLEPDNRPLKRILAIFLILIMVIVAIPYSSIKTDPTPNKILNINSIKIKEVDNKSFKNIYDATNSDKEEIKTIADQVSVAGCESNKICYAKSIYFFVRDNIKYINDPVNMEYFKTPLETLKVKSGDCDDMAILLKALLNNIGVNARFVFVPGHVYIEAQLDEAKNRYKNQFGYIPLDATCKNCEFGEIPYNYENKKYG